MDQKKMGAFLKELRKQKHMTQEQLAEYLNVSGRTVSRWETGTSLPDLDILLTLSDYYRIDLRHLIDGERTPQPMTEENGDTMHKVADYTNCKERLLIRKLYEILISGSIAWGLSFLLTFRFANEVVGVEYLFGCAFACIFLYSAVTFFFQANRTPSGYMTSLIGAFSALILSNCILFLVFFGTGAYHNYGIVGFYCTVCVFALTFLAAGVITTRINRRNKGALPSARNDT